MKKLLAACTVCLVLLPISCSRQSGAPGDAGNGPEESSQGNVAEPGPTVYIENLYATSIRMPHGDFGPELLFDGDPASEWQTMPGTGPDEGVFLEFESNTMVDHIVINRPANSQANFYTYRLYINGFETQNYPITKGRVMVQRLVKSLYLRIVDRAETAPPESGACLSEVAFYDAQGRKMTLVPPTAVRGTVSASSSLDPHESYNADFLFDSRRDFGWADGNTRKDGAGEYLKFQFERPVTIDRIKVWNGYQRSVEHFSANERARQVTFGLEGEPGSQYTLKNAREDFIVPSVPLTGTSFVLKIDSVYPGDKYKDLVISELRFYNGKECFLLETGGMEARKKALLETRTKKAILAKMLDARLHQKINDPDSVTEQSMIIRSNGSFILWFFEETPDSSTVRYADGNWQLVANSRIRIFGRIHTLKQFAEMPKVDPYAGEQEETEDERQNENSIRIFQDFVTLDAARAVSAKGLFAPFQI
ncbi:MAG: NADase-type glycan-binding domain-containing protein [Spirochaetota bacterium]